jgi:hypothetical protein
MSAEEVVEDPAEDLDLEEAAVAAVAEIEAEAKAKAADEPEAETDDDGAGKRLPAEKWAEIETHWECATMTAAKIIETYGISLSALKAHFRRHKIVKGSKKHILKKTAEVKIMGTIAAAEDPIAVKFEQERRGRIAKTRENNYNLSVAVASRATGILKAIMEGTRKEADCANDLKSLRHFEALIKTNTENRLRILKADNEVDEANLPTLIFRDLTEEEIQARAEADDDDDGLGMPDEPIELPEDEDDVIEEGDPSAS